MLSRNLVIFYSGRKISKGNKRPTGNSKLKSQEPGDKLQMGNNSIMQTDESFCE